MNKSAMIAILVLFCLVLGLYFYVKRPHKTHSNEVFSTVTPGFDLSSIDEIRVWTPQDRSGHEFKIQKRGDTYWIQAYDDNESFWAPCQEGRVKRLLESLSGIKGEERAQGQEHFPTFHIGTDEALHFELRRNGSVVTHILVGKRGAQWGTSFVRRDGDDHIYIIQKNLFSVVDIWDEVAKKNPPFSSWIELGIVKDGADSIKGVSYSSAEGVWSLELASDGNSTQKEQETTSRKDVKGQWTLVKDGSRQAIEEGVAMDFLRSLFPLYAKKVRAPSRAHEFGLGRSDNFGRFTIHFKGKGLKILHIGKVDQEKKVGWVKNDQGVIYEVALDPIKKLKSGPKLSPKKEESSHNEQEDKDNP